MGDEEVRGQFQVVAAALGALVLLAAVSVILVQKVLTPFSRYEVSVLPGIDISDLANKLANSIGTPAFNETINESLIKYCLNITVLKYSLINGSLLSKAQYVSSCGNRVLGTSTSYAVINDTLYVVRVEVTGK